jgi:general secretion pathway protein M
MSFLTEMLARLQSAWSGLSGRERRAVGLAVGAVLVFAVFLIVTGFNGRADAIRRRIQSKLNQLDEVQVLAAGYREARAKQEAAEAQLAQSNVRLLSYLEDRASQTGLTLPSISPKPDVPLEGTRIVESTVELVLTDVKLNRLLDFLKAVEAGPGVVQVKELRLEPHPKEEHLTAYLTVVTYHFKS